MTTYRTMTLLVALLAPPTIQADQINPRLGPAPGAEAHIGRLIARHNRFSDGANTGNLSNYGVDAVNGGSTQAIGVFSPGGLGGLNEINIIVDGDIINLNR